MLKLTYKSIFVMGFWIIWQISKFDLFLPLLLEASNLDICHIIPNPITKMDLQVNFNINSSLQQINGQNFEADIVFAECDIFAFLWPTYCGDNL